MVCAVVQSKHGSEEQLGKLGGFSTCFFFLFFRSVDLMLRKRMELQFAMMETGEETVVSFITPGIMILCVLIMSLRIPYRFNTDISLQNLCAKIQVGRQPMSHCVVSMLAY